VFSPLPVHVMWVINCVQVMLSSICSLITFCHYCVFCICFVLWGYHFLLLDIVVVPVLWFLLVLADRYQGIFPWG
jgi:hypothetical protein